MTRTEKSKPLPVDPVLAAAEAERQESLALNRPLQHGKVTAHSNEKANRRGEVTQRLVDLKRTTLKRDTTQAGRDSYDRTWRDCYAKAQRFATAFGEELSIPAYLPPPAVAAADTVRITPQSEFAGTKGYTETRGKGPSGKGLPLTGPGSNTDPEWLTK